MPPPNRAVTNQADLLDLKDVKEELNAHYLPYEADMLAMRKQEVVGNVQGFIKAAVGEASAGKHWTGPTLMRYLSALVTVKHKLEIVQQSYTAKDLTIARGLVEDLSSRILVYLVPYFVFTYCNDPNDQWKVPNVATLLRNKTLLLTQYKLKASHASTSGRFTGH